MARSKIDLDALKQFRLRLQEIRNDLKDRQALTDAVVSDAKTFWKEDAYPIFVARHSEANLSITRFIRQCDAHLDWLAEKERRGRNALNYPL